jgi:hypothetical protein
MNTTWFIIVPVVRGNDDPSVVPSNRRRLERRLSKKNALLAALHSFESAPTKQETWSKLQVLLRAVC